MYTQLILLLSTSYFLFIINMHLLRIQDSSCFTCLLFFTFGEFRYTVYAWYCVMCSNTVTVLAYLVFNNYCTTGVLYKVLHHLMPSADKAEGHCRHVSVCMSVYLSVCLSVTRLLRYRRVRLMAPAAHACIFF